MLFNEENIDAFVSGKMTGAERMLFESDMAKDPLLAREVKMQEDIQSGLNAHRKAELKQRLNNIDMTTASINLGSKVAASVLISAMVGVGLYLAINMTGQTAPQATVATTATAQTAPAQVAKPAQAAPQAQAPQAAPAQAPQQNHNNASATAAPATNNIVVDVPSVEGPSNTDVATSGNETPGSGLGNNANVSNVKSVTPEFKPAHKAGEYSYQYYSSKLFLYGMNNANGVNILEFNKNGKKQLFIYTAGKYYQIKDEQIEIAPLKEIKDQGLINQLNPYVK